MTYTPQPGTIPFKVIEFMKQQPAGSEFTMAVLSEKIGHEGSPLASCLKTAIDNGILKTSKRAPLSGGIPVLFLSLGDGTPLPKPEDYENDEPLHPAPSAPVAAEKPRQTTPAAAPGEQIPLFGIYSDGSMSIAHDGKEIQLDASSTSELLKFMRQVWG